MTSVANPTAVGREVEVRDRIFASALKHFSQKGYAATSLREVSQDAQTTKPMIYYYFNSKEGLYASIVRQIFEEMEEAIRSQLPSGASAPERVRAFCERYMDHFLSNEIIIALALREVFGLGGVPMAALTQTLAQRVYQPLDEILAEGMASGEFQVEDVPECAAAIAGIMNAFILAHVFGGAPIDRERPLRQVGFHICGLMAKA